MRHLTSFEPRNKVELTKADMRLFDEYKQATRSIFEGI